MKLQELAAPNPTRQIARVFESYFGKRITMESLNRKQTASMLTKVRGLIREHQGTSQRHFSERNPSYLKLVMIEQALASRLAEMMPAPAAPAAPGAPTAPAAPAAPAGAAKPIDPKLKAAQDKLKKGQPLSAEEQQLVNTNAAAVAENRLRRAYTMLRESEVQQAQVVLAAQDMVDKMQGMLEDVSELQFKELPALVDSIKNQVGIDQATQFNTDASAALSGLMQNLQGAKQQLDAALGVVTGQTPPPDAGMASMGAAPAGGMAPDAAAAGAELGAEAGAELGAEAGAEAGDELDAAAAQAGSLGRSRR
jgi:hypothetical protein